MGLAGGAADKAGNRYEDWWTALRVAELLRGRATRIRLEPPGPAGAGIEFELEADDGTWCEQVKDVPSKGPWTLNAAGKILKAVTEHLAGGKKVRLVLSTGAPELHDLSMRARGADTLAEFEGMITKAQAPQFVQVLENWSDNGVPVGREVGWRYLQAVYVEHIPPEALRRLVVSEYELLFVGDPEVIVRQLSGYLDEHLHQRLTGSQIRRHLLTVPGVRPRLLAGDTGTLTALAGTVDRFVRRVRRDKPAFGMAARPHVEQLYERLVAEDGPQVVVCEGSAGLGKSAVVTEVLVRLTEQGWPAAAVRMDGADAGVQTAKDLGVRMTLPDSPAVLLAGVADEAPALLVIDQLDAVSTYNGRMSDAYEAVEDVLAQLVVAPNVKVLLVARTIDIDNDRRLSDLVADRVRTVRFPLSVLDVEQVRAVLSASGTDPDGLGPVTLELLRTPLHLSVFSRLSSSARAASYRTLQELYARYTDERREEIERQAAALDWRGITGTLCASMSERETLQVPMALLDGFARQHIKVLESHGVLVRDGEQIGFFHETYFDFLFARSFISTGQDIHDFLANSGQYLFRRAQTRQILEHLAGTDPGRFRTAVARLLGSDRIRPHLHDVIIAVLGQLDAVLPDWKAIEPLAWGQAPVAGKVRGLLALPRWFDAADHDQRWERWLGTPQTADAAFPELLAVARHRPERVAELVRPYVGTTPQWRRRLVGLIEWALTPDLVDLAVDLIDRGYADEARGPIAVNSDFWSLLYGLSETHPAPAARLVGAYLRRHLTRARADGSGDPFASEHLSTNSQVADTVLSRIAQAEPETYVDQVLAFVIDVATASSAGHTGSHDLGGRWAYRFVGGHGVDAALLAALDTALRSLAGRAPAAAADALRQLTATPVQELRFLACRLHTVLGRPDEAIAWLLTDERNLRLGWVDSARWASRELIKTMTPHCTDEMLDRLTAVLLGYYPAWERRRQKGHPSAWGWTQYELLSAICPSRRCAAVRRRLSEWERKFPGQVPSPPEPVRAEFVGSPISDHAARHMTDDQWHRALDKYAHPQPERFWHRRGGVHELARTLGSCAQQQPDRFTDFAFTLNPGSPAAYLCAIVEAVTPHLDADHWERLALHTHQTLGSEAAPTICRALQATPQNFTPALLPALDGYTTDPHPEGDVRDADTHGTRTDLLTAGMNATRGQAALTVAALLFHGSEHLRALTPLVTRLANDPVLAVRVCAAQAVLALMNHDPQIALDTAEQLLNHQDANVYNASTTQRLLINTLIREPSRFAAHLARALQGPGDTAELAGQSWAVATIQGCLTPDLPNSTNALNALARRGAASVFADNIDHYPHLLPLFNDDDADVRKNASQGMRQVFDLFPAQADELVRAFLDSKAFPDHLEHLAYALYDHAGPLPTVAIDACERIVQHAGRELGDLRTHRAADGHHLVSAILRLYRQSRQAERIRCLDVIDRLSQAGAYGLTAALENER
ncbi:hypothetical protein ACFXOL_14215 [Streptomyces californicus]|uniref:hypothetical protein n=1 Tax=Streptomyces TaxID=1883 RepID=UPI00211B61C5|nr:hypothetical protein [Streptomyces sp. CB04723]